MPGKNRKSEQIELLDRVPIRNTSHFGRPLRQHLIVTCFLLGHWGASRRVCLAGLFHSIYGTGTFPLATLTTNARGYARELIGCDSELLVFIFGMSDRRELLLKNQEKPYSWVDHRFRVLSDLTTDNLNDLVEIEVANFLEQIPFGTVESETVMLDMRHRFEFAESHMSVNAREAFHRALDGQAWRRYIASPPNPKE